MKPYIGYSVASPQDGNVLMLLHDKISIFASSSPPRTHRRISRRAQAPFLLQEEAAPPNLCKSEEDNKNKTEAHCTPTLEPKHDPTHLNKTLAHSLCSLPLRSEQERGNLRCATMESQLFGCKEPKSRALKTASSCQNTIMALGSRMTSTPDLNLPQ